jgi:hypothetical protein
MRAIGFAGQLAGGALGMAGGVIGQATELASSVPVVGGAVGGIVGVAGQVGGAGMSFAGNIGEVAASGAGSAMSYAAEQIAGEAVTLDTTGSPLPTSAEVPMLIERLRGSALLVDRVAAIAEIKRCTTVGAHKGIIGAAGLPTLIEVLYSHFGQVNDPDNSDVIQSVLDIMIDLLTPRESDAQDSTGDEVLANAVLMLKEDTNVTILLDLLEVEDMWIRLPSIQLLTLLLNSNAEQLEKAVLSCPAGMDKIMAVLDDRRDEIRNELLLMLLKLSCNSEVQNFMAFSEGFERLFRIMLREGLREGGVIVLDCLRIVHHILGGESIAINPNMVSRASSPQCPLCAHSRLAPGACTTRLVDLCSPPPPLTPPRRSTPPQIAVKLFSQSGCIPHLGVLLEIGKNGADDGEEENGAAYDTGEADDGGPKEEKSAEEGLLSATKHKCLVITLQILRGFVSLDVDPRADDMMLAQRVQGCRQLQEALSVQSGVLMALAAVAFLPFTDPGLVESYATESRSEVVVGLQLGAMDTIAKIIDGHDHAQAAFVQTLVALPPPEHAVSSSYGYVFHSVLHCWCPLPTDIARFVSLVVCCCLLHCLLHRVLQSVIHSVLHCLFSSTCVPCCVCRVVLSQWECAAPTSNAGVCGVRTDEDGHEPTTKQRAGRCRQSPACTHHGQGGRACDLTRARRVPPSARHAADDASRRAARAAPRTAPADRSIATPDHAGRAGGGQRVCAVDRGCPASWHLHRKSVGAGAAGDTVACEYPLPALAAGQPHRKGTCAPRAGGGTSPRRESQRGGAALRQVPSLALARLVCGIAVCRLGDGLAAAAANGMDLRVPPRSH